MKNLAFLDIEATSADPSAAQIIEVGLLVKNEDGKIVDHFNSIINPGNKIPENIIELTGISNKMAESSPEFHEIAEVLYQKLIGTKIVAHKAEFDYQILKNSFNKLGKEFNNKTICTLKMAKTLTPDMKSYSLVSLCAFFGIPLMKNHRAMEDAEAVAGLYENLSLLAYHRLNTNKFLDHHQKIIKGARSIPGLVRYRDRKNKIIKETPVENIHSELCESLRFSPNNRWLITHCSHIDLVECGSFAIAMLLAADREEGPKWSIYSFKNSHGEIIVKCGKVLKNKPALFYFNDKKQALKVLRSLKSKTQKNKYAYREGPTKCKDEIVKRNRLIQDEIRKLKPSIENTLFRSKTKLGGKFQYVLVRGSDKYTTFESNEEFETSVNLNMGELQYKKLRPSSRRALELSMQYIKNQKTKTDVILKVRPPS